MELWVRSQDKENLVKVNRLNVSGLVENGELTKKGLIRNLYDKDEDFLGIYSTKERAFEVLDEIQNILKPKTIVLKDLNKLNEDEMNQLRDLLSIMPSVNSIQELPTYVYEMPEE